MNSISCHRLILSSKTFTDPRRTAEWNDSSPEGDGRGGTTRSKITPWAESDFSKRREEGAYQKVLQFDEDKQAQQSQERFEARSCKANIQKFSSWDSSPDQKFLIDS